MIFIYTCSFAINYICYIVFVAETVFVIPAEAGIQLFRSEPLLSQG